MRKIGNSIVGEILYEMSVDVERLFHCDNLHNLHTVSSIKYDKLFEAVKDDSSTFFHETFYNKLRAGWPSMKVSYFNLIDEIISLIHFNEDFLYQSFPTFRVHLPGNLAVGKFHKDSEFGHPAGEINYIIPLTDADKTATTWCESEPDKGDFAPIKMDTDHLITFPGNTHTHGNYVNEEGYTRVSMDFRILPVSKYKPDDAIESLTRKTKFVEGQYYSRYNHKK